MPDKVATNDPGSERMTGEVISSGLSRYRALTLELAGIIRSALDRARDRKDERREAAARKLLARLSEDRFYLAVLGQHKRGKSSLMNAMIGRNLLPTGILPVTSAIIALHYDSELEVRIYERSSYGSSGFEVRLEDLPTYVSENGNPGNRRNVERAEVGVPAELLRSGFYFVDTPGVGSAVAANTATTRAFLPEVDAAIFVTSFDSPMNELELAFLENIREYARRMFYVINKSDLVSPGDRDEVVRFVQRRIAEHTGDSNARIYVVSAANEIASLNSAASQPDEGVANLRSDLASFLVTEKSREFLLRLIARTVDLLQAERVETSIIESALQLEDDPEALDRFRTILVEVADQAAERTQALVSALRPEVLDALRRWCEPLLGEWARAETEAAGQELAALFRPAGAFLSPWEVADFVANARKRIEREAGRWLHNHKGDLENVVRTAAGKHRRDIAALTASLLPAATEKLGAAIAREAVSVTDQESISEIPLRTPANPPKLAWNWMPPWWSYMMPARVLARRLTTKAMEGLRGAMPEFRTTLLNEITGAGERWLQELEARLETSIRTHATNLEKMAERRSAPVFSTPPGAGEIDRSIDRLTELEQETRNIDSAVSESDGASASEARSRQPCTVCRRASAALYRFLSEFQYALTVDEQRRADHAGRGGFCPLHTWMYESIASPQGISTGYAPVLDLAARRLRALAKEPVRDSIGNELEHVLADPQRCEACAVIRSFERDCLAREAAEIASGKDTSLCLPHFSKALELVSDRSCAARAALRQAEDLERIAENMRLFALKSDAFRHDLAVSAEVNAWRLALQKMAAEKNLAIARRVD